MRYMMTTRKQVINTIMSQVSYYGGTGCEYVCYLNDNQLRLNSYDSLKRQAELYDKIAIDIYRKSGRYTNTIQFTLTPDLIAEYGNWENPHKQVRDSQKTKVYNWQWALAITYNLRTPLTDSGIYDLIDEVCSWWRITIPTWGYAGSKAGSAYLPWSHHIELGQSGKNKLTVLHEVSHAITRYGQPAHGPDFVGVLMAVLWRYADVNINKMVNLATLRKIKFDCTVPMFPNI